MATECIFCKIVAGEVPADVVMSSDHSLAFRDLDPQAPTHVLVIPKQHVAHAGHLQPENGALLGDLFATAAAVARQEDLSPDDGGNGYRLVFNVGDDAGNSVPHLHLHVIGGRAMTWPPG